jgi:hypothetical protein
MTITTRAELDEALRRVLVDAIADEPVPSEDETGHPELVTLASRDTSVARLERLALPRPRPQRRAPR